jgi:hypothetical protein
VNAPNAFAGHRGISKRLGRRRPPRDATPHGFEVLDALSTPTQCAAIRPRSARTARAVSRSRAADAVGVSGAQPHEVFIEALDQALITRRSRVQIPPPPPRAAPSTSASSLQPSPCLVNSSARRSPAAELYVAAGEVRGDVAHLPEAGLNPTAWLAAALSRSTAKELALDQAGVDGVTLL